MVMLDFNYNQTKGIASEKIKRWTTCDSFLATKYISLFSFHFTFWTALFNHIFQQH